MSAVHAPITASATVGEWLDHPIGGGLVRALLAEAGVEEELLAPVSGMPLSQLVEISGGQLDQSLVDDLVREANGGVIPEDHGPALGWQPTPTQGRFASRTVVVTGAAAGIGRAVTDRIVAEGGRVVAVDLSADRLADLVAAHQQGSVVPVAGDLTDSATAEAVVAAAGERIDGLANVAGVNDDFSPAHETTDEVWDRVIAVNLTAPFKLMRAVLPVMVAAGRGAVVNVSSEAGLRGGASGNAYTAAKHGVLGLTRSAATMYGGQGIRVNTVAPGGVATGMPIPENTSEAGMARLRPFQGVMPGLASAVEVAASITFLLSDDAVNLNGVVLPSDGGWSAQ